MELTQGQSEGVRKIALLVMNLDRDLADELLDQLPDDQAQQVRDAVLNLSHVNPVEQQQVIREFLVADGRGLSSTTARPNPAAHPERPRPQDLTASWKTAPASAVAAGNDDPARLQPLDRASERLIAECLADEMPQAIAVALSQLPTQRASEVVAHLPASLQADVLERMVALTPEPSLDTGDIRGEFLQWLNQQIQQCMRRAELATRLATLLDATHSGTRERILHNISHSDANLAKELQQQLGGI